MAQKPLPEGLSFGDLFHPKVDYPFFAGAVDHPFRASASDFDLGNAWWMAECAVLAYLDKGQIEARLPAAGLKLNRFLDSNEFPERDRGTQCFIAEGAGHLIVSFRGTEVGEKADLLTDAKILPVNNDPPPGRVHGGFAAALEAVWPELGDILTDDQFEGHAILFTGHSLGGALATLASRRCRASQVYTFGSPRGRGSGVRQGVF